MSGPEQRSPLSDGIGWASRISAIGFEFALPMFAGSFVDRWLGSKPACTIVGIILGVLVGMMHILRIAKDSSKPV